MFNQERFDELKSKDKLTPAEKGELKGLEKKQKKLDKQSNPEYKPHSDAFGIEATTTMQSVPVRFSSAQKAGIETLAKDLKSQEKRLVIEELGSLRDVNSSTIIRAAVLSYSELSAKEQVALIKQVKLDMLR
jgi:hypothetical protein